MLAPGHAARAAAADVELVGENVLARLDDERPDEGFDRRVGCAGEVLKDAREVRRADRGLGGVGGSGRQQERTKLEGSKGLSTVSIGSSVHRDA